ncbi:vacuolar protein sorting-associated protein 45 [Nematocida displodere]|uniref:Vacuolar protein sorting-associated protein 45 n=1 Tax=Nematocida displodere TaxID=1805483 RepID=A0A177EAV6_9MICR|nr:vacuolar protein sorting-associated protein 45 [Nematocida displodere]
MDVLLQDVRSALSRGEGIKALLLDHSTKKALSPLISHGELLSYDFFLFETIDRERPPISVSCVAILTQQSLDLLVREVGAPRYGEYFVFVTDELSEDEILQIAEKDVFGVVKELQELYIGNVPVDRSFFVTDEPDPRQSARALVCLLRGMGISPRIRYLFGSEVSYKTAEVVLDAFVPDPACNSDLLVLERSFDLFTPLQYSWTYQCMAAEYLHYTAGLIRWDTQTLPVSDNDHFFQDTKFKDILSATEYLSNSLKKIKASREVVGEFVTTLRQRAKDSERLIAHLQALSKVSAECLVNDAVSETMADVIQGGCIDLKAVDTYTNAQKLRLALVARACASASDLSFARMLWNDSPDYSGLCRAYPKEVENFAKTFLMEKVCRKKPGYDKTKSRKLGYIPVLEKLLEKMQTDALSERAFPHLKNAPGENNVTVIFISGGATLLEYKAMCELFARRFPKKECVLVSDKLVTAEDIIKSVKP